MAKNRDFMLSRRRLFQGAAALAAGALLAERSAESGEKRPTFLIVLGAAGGASIIDSFLAIRASECATPGTINCFPDAEVQDIAGSPLRAVDLARDSIGAIPIGFTANQSSFVKKHKDQMLVATLTGTSVNHAVAQERSRTGNNAWKGRTLEECVAAEHGSALALPNVNMATGGFAARGIDDTLPLHARAAPVAAPALWPFGLDGSRGIAGAPGPDLVDAARGLRDTVLEPGSSFYQAFQTSEALELWKKQRYDARQKLEGAGLIERLNLLGETPVTPLSAYGLTPSPDAALLASTFPALLTDELEAQAALAYLLLKQRVSTAVTIAPSFSVLIDQGTVKNPPLAFDFSHNAHRAAQAVMWSRVLGVADKLIGLLKGAELSPGSGESLWDRTLIYVATDFGRTKQRVAGADDFGSGHDLNNGILVVSPLVRGNTVLGGVDRNTGLTYGWNPVTGAPDPARQATEGEVFAGLLDAMDIDVKGSGLPTVTAFAK